MLLELNALNFWGAVTWAYAWILKEFKTVKETISSEYKYSSL